LPARPGGDFFVEAFYATLSRWLTNPVFVKLANPEKIEMKRVRYQVAMSLDGYIADGNDGFDWIPNDPDIDFEEMFAQFDTVLLGRRTFESLVTTGSVDMFVDKEVFVFSKTLQAIDDARFTLVGKGWERTVESLRQDSGKDIWLFGGGLLFQNLLAAGLVDTVEVAVTPTLLGGGISMAPPHFPTKDLAYTNCKVYDKSGIVMLEYNSQAA
jgi:dihydrofolate reductase